MDSLLPRPPIRNSRVTHLLGPFQRFFQLEAAGGVVLLVCAVAAMIWANSPWSTHYFELWHTQVTVGGGALTLSKDLLHWINDGLMVIFFLMVGLEIKRELLVGELASPRQAAMPIVAAIGGMMVPAGIYAALNWGQPGIAGWGVPMATDIAFAVGVLALVGRRAPLALKVFLLAVAIVDDLGAVLVIALFYTSDLSMPHLIMAGGWLALLILANRLDIHWPLIYIVLGTALWIATLQSGVHATVAGVLLAMTIPASRRIDDDQFVMHSQSMVDAFRDDLKPGPPDTVLTEKQASAVSSLEAGCEAIQTPLARMEHSLVGYVAFAIMPIFAFANAGVAVGGDLGEALTNRVTLGVILGLVVGKQIGVTLFAWLAVKTGLAAMPKGTTWGQIYGVSCLCGIGFTMSLFISNLAFTDDIAPLLDNAKVGILTASAIMGVVGFVMLMRGQVDSDASA